MNEKFPAAARELMDQRFGRDALIALATLEGQTPWVRTVNSYYEAGAFYVITHARSHKMRQIARNPVVALCGEWFTAHGIGENLGYIGAEENQALAATLRTVFAGWYDNGHIDEGDPDTVILCVHLTDGVLLSHGTRYELTFD